MKANQLSWTLKNTGAETGVKISELKCQTTIEEQLITLCSHTFKQNEPVKTERDMTL